MVQCYGRGVKYSLLIANFIIFVIGIALLGLGIWTVSDRTFVERLLGIKLYLASAIILIVTGTIVCVIALLGSLGAYKELKYMLKSYFFILLALAILIVSLGSVGFAFRTELDGHLQKELQKSMQLFGSDNHVTEAWNSLQIGFGCCGVSVKGLRGFESWRKEAASFNGSDGPTVPLSCCRSQEDDSIRRACQSRQPKKEDTYFDDCYEKMKINFKEHSMTIGIVGIFAVAFIATGLLLSGILYIIIGRQDRKESINTGDDAYSDSHARE